ncbi:high-temperature-induced dauer-formation protein-domain-containing protein [Amylostereum chailletii]|nr:high-temperature-induced dauer-formation protein-domain-containing protein [Amylostereum chailletii]
MFKIPQKLSAPFGLLGDEAKLGFRSQPTGIAKLASTRNISESDAYWDQYLVLFDTPSDVFSLISPHDIRRALLEAPENVATLVRVITSRLFNLVSDHTFPTPLTVSVTSFAASFMKTSERNTTKEVLNCLRVLQRVLPVVFEIDSESSIFEQEVFWKQDLVEGQDALEETEQTPQFVIDDDEDEGTDAPSNTTSSSAIAASQMPQKTHPCLAERLFSCLVDLLFCCGFTLPTKIQVDHYKINYIIWEKGIGSTVDPGPNHIYDSNKTEVLRLLLVILSRQIYSPPSALFTSPSLYSLHFVQKTPRRDVLTILCSLLNIAMNSPQTHTNMVAGVTGRLPYNHLHRTADFAFIIEGIHGILEQQMASCNNLLPGSRKSVLYITETIMFFWKIVELNKKFRTYFLEQDKSMDIIAYLLCYFLEIKDKPQQHGLCRALSYIIQTLSSESSFGLKLSFPIKPSHLPTKWNVGGAAADFMINSIYFIVATTSGALNSIYPALIIALSNSAPYFRDLTVNSSTRLLQLFTAFANPAFLLADEGNPRLLFFLLEAFNAVISYHLPENPNLVYAILRSHKTFEDLGTFNLARAKEEQARKVDTKGKGRAVEEQPHEEKQRLLEREHNALGLHSQTQSVDSLSEVRVESPPDTAETSENSVSAQPLMSPTLGETPLGSSFPAVSEKARGKMKARRSTSLDTNGSLDLVAAANVGRNGFVPTQEWVTSWQQG